MAKDFMGSRPPPMDVAVNTVVVAGDVYISADSLLHLFGTTKEKYDAKDVMRIRALCAFFEDLVKEAVEKSHG